MNALLLALIVFIVIILIYKTVISPLIYMINENKRLKQIEYKLTNENTTLKKELEETNEKNTKIKKSFLETEKDIQLDYDNISGTEQEKFTYVASLMADYLTYDIFKKEENLRRSYNYHERQRASKVKDIREETKEIIKSLKISQYQLEYIILKHPELKDTLKEFSVSNINMERKSLSTKEYQELFLTKIQLSDVTKENSQLKKDIEKIKAESLELYNELNESYKSNLTAFPYMASIVADYQTYGFEILAKKLDWGSSQERAKKVIDIREIRKIAKEICQQNLVAKYQLDYLLEIFPNLQDIIETDYNELPDTIKFDDLSDYDKSKDWLSKEEYQTLSSIERNQLALDRYVNSHNKTKWQIGRDYELYVRYLYEKEGYSVDTFGSYMGLEDLGRDLIAKKDGKVIIIQCKYWSREKTIHEKHITQLYGTVASYCVENNVSSKSVTGWLITNTKLSDTAKKMAEYLNIKYSENLPKGEYPCIKCNINYGENGELKKIYHLPFDQKYDVTQITKKGEFYALTVKEAEEAGFRRAFKWFGT